MKEPIYKILESWFADMHKTTARVATFGTEKSKSALITAARGLGFEPEIGLFLASLVPIDRGFPRKLSVCMEGDDDNKPIREFVQAMNEYPEVWQVAQGIEGLINSLSQHAAAIVIIENDELFSRTSLMTSPNGGVVTAYSLDDIDSTIGLVKYDMLVVNALDAIQTTLYLLAEHGYIDWQGSLKETYDKYLHPSRIDYKTIEMWQLLHQNKVLGAFQYDSPQGVQAVDLIRPTSLGELAAGNSAMRLMANEFHPELPLITYSKQKYNLKLWYNDLHRYGLQEDEIQILEKYLLPSYGVCIEQEIAMLLSMDSKISNFTMTEANKLRKTIAKKKLQDIEKLKELFYEKGTAIGTRQQMLDYVWNEAFAIQLGYSFSLLHSTVYSVIAVQQLNLNYYYPPIFWATARLMVESDAIDFVTEDLELLSDEDDDIEEKDEKDNKSVNYFKMSSALGKLRSFGIDIQPPDINRSSFTFSPSVDENKIYFGLKGISRVGNKLIYDIINNRPYQNLEDFLDRVKVNKIQATMLIKAGAFDVFGNRDEMLFQYCDSVADKKKRLTLQNVARLIELNLIPESLNDLEILFKLNKFLKKESTYGDIIIITPGSKPYIEQLGFSELSYDEQGNEYTQVAIWEKFYKKNMEKLKKWISQNHDSLLETVNKIAVQELLDKYAKGDTAYREMEALSYYYSYHELDTPLYHDWLEEMSIVNFFDLPEEPQVEWENENGAKKFRLYKIVGTAIGRDKTKHIVGLLTPDGFCTAKIYRSTFNKYDKMIKENGRTDKSWFSKGSKLLLQGYRNGDTFIVKGYKDSPHTIYQIVEPRILENKRLGE